MAEAEQAEEALVRSAGRAAKLALLCLVVALLVLAIDNRIKREIVQRGNEALRLLDEARKLAEEARSGRTAGEDRAAPGAGEHSDNGVVHDAGASAEADHDAGTVVGSPVDWTPRGE